MSQAFKLIWQLTDLFRSSLTEETGLFLATQMLTWAKLSEREQALGHDIRHASSLTADSLNRVWADIGTTAGEHGRGFTGWPVPTWVGTQELNAALHLCQRALESGILQHLDVTDSATFLETTKVPLGFPAEVADLLVMLLAPQPGETAYLPWDTSGQFLGRISSVVAEAHAEALSPSPLPYLIALLSDGQCSVAQADPILNPTALEGGRLRTFDLSLAFPPFGVKYSAEQVKADWYGRFPEQPLNITVLAIRHLLAQTKSRSVVAVPNSLLFGRGAELSLRQDLLKNRQIEAVLTLPSGLLFNTAIPFSILILNLEGHCDRVRFIEAPADDFRQATTKAKGKLINLENLVRATREPELAPFAAEASVEDILKNDAHLQPSRYVQQAGSRQLQAWLRSAQTVPLGELVSTARPLAATSSAEGLAVMEVGTSDIGMFGYISSAGREVRVEHAAANKGASQFLQPGDIVLFIKGHPGKVGLITSAPNPGPGGWIASQSAIVLRGQNINQKWLFTFLRSEIGQALISQLVLSSTIPTIKVSELLLIPVPVPSRAEQAAVEKTFDEELALQAQIEALWRRQAELVQRHWTLN